MAIQSSRIKVLNAAAPLKGGRFVLYWMQASQRTSYNHALEYAVEEANTHGLPVVVCFGLTASYPEANARHYAFLLEGLAQVQAELGKRGIGFVIRRGAPDEVALGQAHKATLIVCDRCYLKPQKAGVPALPEAMCRVVQVESDVVVPVERAS